MDESEDWVKLPGPRRSTSVPSRLPPSQRLEPRHGHDAAKHPLEPARQTVSKEIPSYLKLVTDSSHEASTLAGEDLAAIADVAGTFRQATGWRLEVGPGDAPRETPNLMWSAPVNPGVGIAPGHIRLFSQSTDANDPGSPVSLDDASRLAGAVGNLWGELIATRHALWQREAELAAGVPLVVRNDRNTPHLSQRLEAVLQAGVDATGCDAAALYLLDSATSELKLRSSWGMPRRRLTEPARPLRGALADLEALLGHAVVLSDPSMHDYWKVPEAGFATCVCVPVASPSMPLGTLWIYCRQPRNFSDAQTNVLEVVAGRIASDLEREVLLDEASLSREHTKQVVAAQRAQQGQLPAGTPLVDDWDVAARLSHAGPLGGTFYDWFALEDGSLAVVAGDALQHGVAGALTATALRSAARTIAPSRDAVERLPEKANAVLWTGASGNQCGGLFQAILESASPRASLAAAGPLRVLSIAAGEATVLAGPSNPIGWQAELHTERVRHEMADGELLLVYGTGYLADCDELTLATLDAHLAQTLEPVARRPATELVEAADGALRAHPGIDAADRALVVIQCRAD